MQLLEKSRLNSKITYFRNDVLPGQYEGSKKIVSTIISNFRYRHLHVYNKRERIVMLTYTHMHALLGNYMYKQTRILVIQ